MFLPIWEEHFLFKPFVANNCAPASPLFIRAFIHSCIRGKQMRACEPTHIRTLTHLLHQLPATSHLSEHPHSQDWKDSVWTLISVPPAGVQPSFSKHKFFTGECPYYDRHRAAQLRLLTLCYSPVAPTGRLPYSRFHPASTYPSSA